ncbi:MAG: hypothetical protein ACKOXK_11240 [Chakrabartia sp.]
MTRLFLYLLALVAGLSPAEARHVARPESVAVGQMAEGVQVAAARTALAEKAHLHLVGVPALNRRLLPAFSGLAPLPVLAIRLTDRPRA